MPVVELHRLKNDSDCPIWSSTSKLAIKVQGDKSEILDVNGRAHAFMYYVSQHQFLIISTF